MTVVAMAMRIEVISKRMLIEGRVLGRGCELIRQENEVVCARLRS
jgi:hypothetical protein